MKEIISGFLNSNFDIETVSAHCDIPCKIYDPISAQIATLTMIRIVDLIEELDTSDSASLESKAQFVRLVLQKEEHGLKVKEEIRVIWGDYFKTPQFESFPEIHDLAHSIMLECSKSKQNLSKDSTLELLKKVNRFAEIFWATKEVKTEKKISPYAPNLEIVVPVL